jgi:uncharacterized protein YdaU (DUF1376 family)
LKNEEGEPDPQQAETWATEERIRSHFEKCGKILDVTIKKYSVVKSIVSLFFRSQLLN